MDLYKEVVCGGLNENASHLNFGPQLTEGSGDTALLKEVCHGVGFETSKIPYHFQWALSASCLGKLLLQCHLACLLSCFPP